MGQEGSSTLKIEQVINQHYDQLNKNDLEILKYVVANKTACSGMGINAMAEECLTSRTTILRLAKKLGFEGFSEFKAFLRWEDQNSAPAAAVDQGDLLNNTLKETLRMNDAASLKEICQLIERSRRVFVFGTGNAQEICAEEMRRMFLYAHKYFTVIKHQHELETLVRDLDGDDLIIIISLSGNTPYLEKVIRELTLRDVPFLSITQMKQNKLAQSTPYNLYGSTYDFPLYNDQVYSSTLFLYVLTERIFYAYSSYISKTSGMNGN